MNLTLILVIMTGIISYQAFENTSMRNKLLFHPASVKEFGEYYRFLTHGFVHANWQHLLINLFVLYQFGEVIESIFASPKVFGPTFGRILYVLLYLTAIVLASIPSYFKHQDNQYYSALGASGATSALVFAYILFNPWGWFLFPPLPAILFGVAYLWYSSYMSKRGVDNIGHDAHFWGAVYGAAFTIGAVLVFRPSIVTNFINVLLAGPEPPPFF